MTNEIQIAQLEKRYGKEVLALNGVDLTVTKGVLFTLLGPNGAGKTTLVRILTGLAIQDMGTVRISGFSPSEQSVRLRRYIGVASQENELDTEQKAIDLLLFQCRIFGQSVAEARQRSEELIAQFGLETAAGQKAGSLSGGNKRRLHCALALAHRPQLLFLDEPTVGMDPEARSAFWSAIAEMNRREGITVFLTTQYLEEADKHASEMALLFEGKIRFAGTVNDFKAEVGKHQDSTLEESYLEFLSRLRSSEYFETSKSSQHVLSK